MKRLFCYIGLHSWKLKKEKHQVINHEFGRDCVRVIVRQCSICGKRQQLREKTWKNCSFEETSIINLQKIKKQ